MSRWATAFLLLAAVAVVVCAIVFVSLKSHGGKPVGSALFGFDPDDISLIKITNGDGVVEFRRTEGGWYLGPEPKDRASVDAVRRLIDTALSTPVLDRIDAGELDDRDRLSTYGLKKSRVQFDFRGDRDLPLLIGKDAADESRAYVRFEDSRDIYLIPDDLVNLILTSPQDFRDRRPVRLRPDRVDRIVINRPAGQIELRRETSGWQIIKPLSAPASASAIEALLGKLLRLRIEGFEPSADPGVMGLSEPAAEVQLFGEGSSAPETIRVGTSSPRGGVYARLEPRDVTVRLPSSIHEILGFDLAALRDNSLARINLDLVDMIRVTTSTSSFALKRKDDGWVIGSKPASAASVQRMVDAFALIKATKFEPATVGVLDKSGLSHPPLVVEFYAVVSENTPETTAGSQLVAGLKFGTKQESGLVPVLKTGSPEIAFVPEKILEAVPPEESSWQAP
ncbi:MAG: DUF4340 domain-containing protein [Terrimicrobiaceae bacterium]|nr:DUF4340 domain-containing protein [Terrimicrobiaceae bacterium]